MLLQRTVLISAFFIVLGMTLFPPWVYVYDPPERFRAFGAVKSERPAGYHFFFGSPVPPSKSDLIKIFNLNINSDTEWAAGPQFFSSRIDATRLTIQIVVSSLLTAILCLALRSKPERAVITSSTSQKE